MGNEKLVLPDTEDTFVNRVKRGALKNKENDGKAIIYSPDNEPMTRVNMEAAAELADKTQKRKS
ncbi:MAG: hypothetical protein H0Z35_11095 [Thermoanaerobacteraceae bacterium]|nr:hypothetical protein [Thermoanaerobacteraceae bacterium]